MAKYRLMQKFDGIRQERNWESFRAKTCCHHMSAFIPLRALYCVHVDVTENVAVHMV